METCAVCGGTKFYKEAGYFFCEECQTQNEELREEVLEKRYDTVTRLKKTKVRAAKSEKSDQVLGWTTWERYNFILIGLTNELIELGVTPHIKLTVLQLWATYLGKLEVAFTSTKKKNFPKLARQFHKKDAEIIYGKALQQKRSVKRKRFCSTTSASSMISGQQNEITSVSKRELSKRKSLMAAAEYDKFIQTQTSSEGDAISLTNQSFHSLQSSASRVSTTTTVKFRFSKHAKEESKKVKLLSEKLPRNRRKTFREKHVTASYLASPYIITPAKLWAILYIALRIHKQNIQLGDMLRYSREGHLSYYKLDHLLPPDMQVTTADLSTLTTRTQLSHRGMRHMIMDMVKLLEVREMATPDLLPLITYYCRELQLPRGILLYTERFIAFSPPQMPCCLKSKLFPNYEGRAMAFIIVVLKVLFALDGVTEYEMSRFAEEMNRKHAQKFSNRVTLEYPKNGASIIGDRRANDYRLFSFREWQRYIECRRTVLTSVHFPTKLKYDPELPNTSHLYIRFLRAIQSKKEGHEPALLSGKKYFPQELSEALARCVEKLDEDTMPLREVESFSPSLTPQYSYLEQLLEHPLCDLPGILRTNFVETKVGYLTKPEYLKRLAVKCGISLKIIDSNLHFIEKIVPPFGYVNPPTVEEMKEYVRVEDPTSSKDEFTAKSEDPSEFLHKKRVGRFKIDVAKQKRFDRERESVQNRRNSISECYEDYAFDEVLPDGKLLIPDDDFDSENNADDVDNLRDRIDSGRPISDSDYILRSGFMKKYNLYFSSHETNVILHPQPEEELICCVHDRCSTNVNGNARSSNSIRNQSRESSVIRSKNGEESKSSARTGIVDHKENICSGVERNLTIVNRNWSEKDENNTEVEISGNAGLDAGRKSTAKSDNHFDLVDDDISILVDNSFDGPSGNESNADRHGFSRSTDKNIVHKLFRPCKDYWLYDYKYGQLKPKDFDLLEKELPVSFRWLLKECANIVEMTTEDLYHEICLVEAYYAHVLKADGLAKNDDSNVQWTSTKGYRNIIINKW